MSPERFVKGESERTQITTLHRSSNLIAKVEDSVLFVAQIRISSFEIVCSNFPSPLQRSDKIHTKP
jgi:hypothetical protein